MSQQKMLLTVCLAVAFVALAQGQLFDPQRCTQGIQNAASQYRQTMTSLMREYIQGMSAQSQQGIDMQQLNSNVQKLMDLVSSMADTSEGFSANKYMSTSMEIARTQWQITRTLFNPNMGIESFRNSMALGNSMTNAYTNFITSIPDKCMPQ